MAMGKKVEQKKGVLSLLSLRNIVLAMTAAHLFRKILTAARRFVPLRLLFGLETQKSRYSFQHGGQIFAEAIAKHNVKYLFTSHPEANHPLLLACQTSGIQVIKVKSPAVAVQAAEIVFRVTKVPATVFLPNAPELMDALGAIMAAKYSQSGVIIIGESIPVLLLGRGARQEAKLANLARSSSKHVASVSSIRSIAGVLEESFLISRSDVPGPVFLEVFRDVFFPENQMIEQYRQLINLDREQIGWLRDAIHKYTLTSLYATDSFRVRPSQPLKLLPMKPTDFLLDKSIRILKRAKRPVVVLGSQAVPAYPEIEALQSQFVALGLPLYLFGDAKGLLGNESPSVHYRGLRTALQRSDLVLLLGLPQDFRLSFGEMISGEAFVIAVNKSKIEMMRNRRPALSILADPALFIQSLGAKAKIPASITSEWTSWQKQILGFANTDSKNINTQLEIMVSNVLVSLEEISDGAHVIACGEAVEKFAHNFHVRSPFGWLEAESFGSETISAGYALASALLFERRDIWVLDSSSHPETSLKELEFMAEHQHPAVFVLFHGPEGPGPVILPEKYQDQVIRITLTKDTDCITAIREAQSALHQKKIVIVQCLEAKEA